jgi:YidC/Oxa1 family membrane protein insertase
MEKRLVLAIALSVLIIITFQYLVVKPASNIPPTGKKTTTPAQPLDAVKETELKRYAPPAASAEEKEFSVETDSFIIVFSNIGGSIKNIKLKNYNEPGSREPFKLAEIKDPREYIGAVSDLTSVPALDTASYHTETGYDIITFSLNAKDIEVTKSYVLRNSNHGIELQLIIKNISDRPKDIRYRLITCSGLSENNIQDKRFVEVASNLNGKTATFKKTKEGRVINPGIVGWLAVRSKYFAVAAKPLNDTQAQFYSAKGDSFLAGIEAKELTLPAGSSVEHRYLFYAGPVMASELKAVNLQLEEVVDYGIFGWISKPLLLAMKLFYRVVRNWGVSLILLSVFLNIILFPLSLKSFRSMQKMQALHPQMEKLKAQYKDNAQKLNKEMMELYRKNNINPLGGCLPMLLQMPIFIALYNGLMKSIELRGAKFLWMKDLSMPDAVKIPVSLPFIGNSVNILPLLMIAAMVLQQKVSAKSTGGAVTEEQRQQQKMMLILMPVMFGFIFYNMPSGLVLYWLISTILTLVEQYFIFRTA